METVTNLLELVGMLLLVAAGATAVGVFTPLGIAGALAVAGVGLIVVSFIVTLVGAARR